MYLESIAYPSHHANGKQQLGIYMSVFVCATKNPLNPIGSFNYHPSIAQYDGSIGSGLNNIPVA